MVDYILAIALLHEGEWEVGEIERDRYHRPKPLPADQRFCPSCQQLGRNLFPM